MPGFMKTMYEDGRNLFQIYWKHLVHQPRAHFFPSSSLFCVCQLLSTCSWMKIQDSWTCKCKQLCGTQKAPHNHHHHYYYHHQYYLSEKLPSARSQKSLNPQTSDFIFCYAAVATAAKSLQSCPTLCDPTDGSPPGSPVPGIFQARTLEWVAISFSNAWKWSRSVVSDSSQPHRLQPTRLLHPWDFPGKSTGVGCHRLLCLNYTSPQKLPNRRDTGYIHTRVIADG